MGVIRQLDRAGVSAYEGAHICSPSNKTNPVWCANRFGQSLTRIPDGRIVQIGGEHEDFYDEDFCIEKRWLDVLRRNHVGT